MKVAVVYASKHGFTKGIAEHIRNKFEEHKVQVDLRSVDELRIPEDYDAFIIGSAVFFGKWMKEAHQFVTRNQGYLTSHPVWLFSSGPTGTSKTDKNGRDMLEASVPSDIAKFKQLINPRDHHVFYGGYSSQNDNRVTRWFVQRLPESAKAQFEGDFRDWTEIGNWAESIVKELEK